MENPVRLIHPSSRKLFVGGLSYATTDETLVVTFRNTLKSRGFGFVVFLDEESCRLALEEKNQAIDGRIVEIKRALPASALPRNIESPNQSNKVFIGGIGDIGEEELKEYFEKFGQVASVDVILDRRNGSSRGFGFVTFEDMGVATRVRDLPHFISGKNIDVGTAVPKQNSRDRIPPGIMGDHHRPLLEDSDIFLERPPGLTV